MRFKLFGTEIYVSFLFAAVLTVMLACDRTGLLLPSLFAVGAHEIGHLFAMWILECAPKRVRLIPASVQITSSFTKKYNNDIAIAFCGPLVNLVLFLTLYINYLAFKNQNVLNFALLNLIIAIFNLMPVAGLDGGTILYSLLLKKTDMNKAALIVKIITLLSAAATLFAAVTLTFRGKLNISLYIIAVYLITMCIMKL